MYHYTQEDVIPSWTKVAETYMIIIVKKKFPVEWNIWIIKQFSLKTADTQ